MRDPVALLTRPEPSTDTFSTFTAESLVVAEAIEGEGCPPSAKESDDALSEGAGEGDPDDSTQLRRPEVDMAGEWEALIPEVEDGAADPASERVSCSCTMSMLEARLEGGR